MNTNNNAEVLHLTEPMVLDLIKKVEQSIHEVAEKMESKRQNLKEAEELYMPLKHEWDNLQAQMDKEKVLLQTLVGFKENTNLRKNVKVFRSITNSSPKKERRQRFPITKEAINVLTAYKSFLRPKNLVDKMYEMNPEWSKISKNIERDKEKTIFNLKTMFSRGTGKLTIYNDKFGLPQWLDDSGTPRPEFLNSLIHA